MVLVLVLAQMSVMVVHLGLPFYVEERGGEGAEERGGEGAEERGGEGAEERGGEGAEERGGEGAEGKGGKRRGERKWKVEKDWEGE